MRRAPLALSRFCFRRCQHRKQFHFSFASFYFELLPLKHRIPLGQLEFSKQIPDILLYRQKTLFCWDELELHFLCWTSKGTTQNSAGLIWSGSSELRTSLVLHEL